jgi:hypothetical protein
MKLDHGLAELPGMALHEILEIQRIKETQYRAALTGYRLGSAYRKPNPTPEQKKKRAHAKV